MDKYESNYKEKQTGTHLEWMHHLGSVDIEVELRDQTLELTCSPFQAALLLSLSENRNMNYGKTPHILTCYARSSGGCWD